MKNKNRPKFRSKGIGFNVVFFISRCNFDNQRSSHRRSRNRERAKAGKKRKAGHRYKSGGPQSTDPQRDRAANDELGNEGHKSYSAIVQLFSMAVNKYFNL